MKLLPLLVLFITTGCVQPQFGGAFYGGYRHLDVAADGWFTVTCDQ